MARFTNEGFKVLKTAVKDACLDYSRMILTAKEDWQKNKCLDKLNDTISVYHALANDQVEDSIDRAVQSVEDWLDIYLMLEE